MFVWYDQDVKFTATYYTMEIIRVARINAAHGILATSNCELPAPAIVPLQNNICHIFWCLPTERRNAVFMWWGNQFRPEDTLRTDPEWGQRLPCFIVHSPLMDLTGPAALQEGVATFFTVTYVFL